jgi:hypothetical protein
MIHKSMINFETKREKIKRCLDNYKKGLDNETKDKFIDKWINKYKFAYGMQDNQKIYESWKKKGGLNYSFGEQTNNIILEHSEKLFTIKTIKDDIVIYIFLYFIEQYSRNGETEMIKGIYNSSTSKTRKEKKKENAIKGAISIIDFLGGDISVNKESTNLKLLLRDFLNNIEKYEIKKTSFNYRTTKEDLEFNLNLIIKNKSIEIREFIKEL